MKKITAFTMGIILLIEALSGCSSGGSEENIELVNVNDLNNSVEISAIKFTENTESGSNNDPQSAADPLAEINIPKTAEYITGTAEFSLFDPEAVKKAFWGDKEITPEILDYIDDRHPYPIYIWKKDGMRLYVNNNSISADISSAFTLMLDNFTHLPNYNIDSGMDEFEHNADELDFCSREQAVKNVKAKLAEINVNVSENADVYAICQSDLQKKVDEEIAANKLVDYNDYIKGEENPKLITSYTVDKSQECYLMVLKEEYNGVPFYNYHLNYITIQDLCIFQPSIKVYYSVDGIIGLDINEYRANITEEEKITSLITAKTASEIVSEKYENLSGIEKIMFDKVELMYAVTPNHIDGKINVLKAKIIPAWVCTIHVTQNGLNKRTGQEEIMTDKKTVLIDARTGVEII